MNAWHIQSNNLPYANKLRLYFQLCDNTNVSLVEFIYCAAARVLHFMFQYVESIYLCWKETFRFLLMYDNMI